MTPSQNLEQTDYTAIYERVSTALNNAWKPPPNLTVAQWAERYAVLPAESSSEPGRWHAYGYQLAIMDACCNSRIERVTVMKSARIGYTKLLGHLIGYRIHQDPGSILIVQPTIADAEGWSKQELMPVVEQTPVLRALIAPPRSRDSGNTILVKRFPGGILHIVGANSPTGFRRITVRMVLLDELDGYPATSGIEGDPAKLAEMRCSTAWNRLIVSGSTPTEAGISRIERAFDASSRGHYVLTCPHCSGEHVRRLLRPDSALRIRGESMPVAHLDLEQAVWICPHCATAIDHSHHRRMIDGGFWMGEDWSWRPGRGFEFLPTFAGHIGFHIWSGYGFSPSATPDKLAREYLSVRDNPEQFKTFTNTVLGDVYREPGEQLDADLLIARAERYSAAVPEGVLVLTCGVDVQSDRLELEVTGWGVGEESWSIDYQVLVGDPVQDEVWADLLDVWKKTSYSASDGQSLRLSAMCVDSGFLPRRVYRFVQAAAHVHVYPVKGRAGAYPIIAQTTERARRQARRKKAGAVPEMIGVDEAKAIIARRLKIVTQPGPGYAHFPHDRATEWFRQLTGERMVTRYPRGGRPVREWKRVYSAVEALDCRVYAFAALLLSGADLTPKPAPAPAPARRNPQPAPDTFGKPGWNL